MQDLFKSPSLALILIPFALIVVPIFISKISGWSALARRFNSTLPFTGKIWRAKSARLRSGVGYNNCLTIGAAPEGLYLAIMISFIFRGHPPLLIPWSEVFWVADKKTFGIALTQLSLGREEAVPFTIRKSLAAEIQAAAGASWPVQTIR